MLTEDKRTFNIADAGGAGTETPTDPGLSPGADSGGQGAGSEDGGSTPPAPVFADWSAEALTPLLPEGFAVDETQAAKLVEIVNASKGDPAGLVKGMLGYYTEASAAAAEQLVADFNKIQETWQSEMRSDPTYGGAKFDENLRVAKETAQRLGGNEFLDMLRVTGAGNNVHMLRFLMKAAEILPKEASPVGGRPSGSPKSLAERLLGETT